MENWVVFSGSSNRGLAEKIASDLDIKLGEVEIKKFSDGEKYVRFLDTLRGKNIFLIQSISNPVDENLMELLIMIDAAKRASAEKIIALIPYMGYARQDRKAKSREPITAKLVANLLEKTGITKAIFMDLHAGQEQGFFDIPVDNLSAKKIFDELIDKAEILVAADTGSVKRIGKIIEEKKKDLAVVVKERNGQNVKVRSVIGDVKGKNCLIIDDMIDTAGTICEGAKVLKENGAKEIIVCATHGVFSGPAIERIEKSEIDKIYVTNSISQEDRGKIKVLDVSPLLACAVRRTVYKRSFEDLF